MLSKGVFVLDIDVELAWGMIDKKMDKEKMRKASMKARKLLDDLIFLLEKYDIPVTWGILGHVILERCEKRFGVAHPEMPRSKYTWMKRDWYEYDPCKKITDEPAFYGKDVADKIVNYIRKTKIPHDVASHSFSHQIFGDPGCNEEVAEAEVKRCIELMEENYGIRPKVFIFPRDCSGHFDVLKRNGIIAFRGQIPRIIAYSESGRGAWALIRKQASLTSYLLSFYLTIPPPVSEPVQKHGLVDFRASLCFNKKPYVPLKLIVLKAIKGINRAVKEKRMLHLYTHLINFGETRYTKAFIEGFEEILAQADICRKRNQLEITTMRNIAKKLLQRNREHLLLTI